MAPTIHESESEVDIPELSKVKYGADSELSSELSDAAELDDDEDEELNYGSEAEEDAGSGSEVPNVRVDEEAGSDDAGEDGSDIDNTLNEDDSELEEEEDEEIPGISDDEEEIQIEDPDEMDEDLELREEEEEYDDVSTIKINAPMRMTGNRESRKRQLTYYEEDDEDDEVEEERNVITSKKSRSLPRPKLQPQDIDEDLILTDEEQEYNPHANPDLSKMTERQRSRYLEEIDNKQEYIELNDQNNAKKGSRPRRKETEQEELLRKAESARRRQDHKNKQEEEEKRDTINKLLKRRANKTRTTDSVEGSSDTAKVVTKPRRPISQHPALFRYISTTDSTVLAYN